MAIADDFSVDTSEKVIRYTGNGARYTNQEFMNWLMTQDLEEDMKKVEPPKIADLVKETYFDAGVASHFKHSTEYMMYGFPILFAPKKAVRLINVGEIVMKNIERAKECFQKIFEVSQVDIYDGHDLVFPAKHGINLIVMEFDNDWPQRTYTIPCTKYHLRKRATCPKCSKFMRYEPEETMFYCHTQGCTQEKAALEFMEDFQQTKEANGSFALPTGYDPIKALDAGYAKSIGVATCPHCNHFPANYNEDMLYYECERPGCRERFTKELIKVRKLEAEDIKSKLYPEKSTSDKVLDHLFGKKTLSPRKLYIGLVNEYGVEPYPQASGYPETGYSRVSVNPGETFGYAEHGKTSNRNDIVFPRAIKPWGRLVGFIIRDENNNALFGGDLFRPIHVNSDDQTVFPAGSLDISLEGEIFEPKTKREIHIPPKKLSELVPDAPTDPKNNEGLETCYWCNKPTVKIDGLRHTYDFCHDCEK